jgi:cytochrome P450
VYAEVGAPGAAAGPVLDRVIKESLRILPPVVFTSRRVMGAATLAGRPVPLGAIVVVSFYDTHHLPELFPEPERFRPDRWVGATVSPYAYLPFAAGPRMCLGAAFSLRLFQVVIPAIVRRYRLAIRPRARVDRQSSLTMGVRGRLPAVVLAQDGRFGAAALTGNFHEMVHVPQAEPLRRAA